VIIAANQDGVFARLCDAMGAPELAGDPQYATHVARGEAQGELDRRIDAWSSALTMAEVEALCEEHGVPCGRVNRAPELLADPHVAAREAIVEAHDRVLGAIKMQAAFPKFSETPGNVRWAAPDPGAHNAHVFRDLLGYSEERLQALQDAGIV
jgi:formyl-CoA transferase